MKQKKNSLQHLEWFAKLLDNQFKIGGFSFGIDPLLGLIPVLGDIIPLIFSVYLIILAKSEDLEDYVIHQMIGNMVIDFIIGTVPLVGDVGDFFFKASQKNLLLLKRELDKKYNIETAIKID